MTNEKLESLGQAVAGALPGAVTSYTVTPFAHTLGELTVAARAEDIVAVMKHLRDDAGCAFQAFVDITAVDWPQRENRFDIVYHLLSPTQNARIRVKIEAGETASVASVVDVFPGANWFEREVYDLYGVVFTGHPDMRRILTDYGFEGHPLRKDFPLPDSSKCAGTTSRSASSTAPCNWPRNSAISISCRRGKGRTIRCPATRRPGQGRLTP